VSESVSASGVKKCALIAGKPALLEIAFESDNAHCRVDCAPHEGHRAIVRMLGIDSDAAGFERQFSAEPLLGTIVTRQKGLRIPLTPQPWEALAWAIVGQQISVRFAVALRRELIGACGELHPSGLRAHPTPEAVAALDVDSLRKLKFSGSKAEYLLAAARAVASGELPLASLREMSASRGARLLGGIRGIGPWTVEYALLRGLGFADCLPSGDVGLARGLARLLDVRPSEVRIRELLATFSPWRSLATYHIWTSLRGDCE
jgi:3-methyladenine DNA glycosylase/8-oxoguanine DNA glycosylase